VSFLSSGEIARIRAEAKRACRMNIERLYDMLARARACRDLAAIAILEGRIAAAWRASTRGRMA
jgi:dihydroxyacetone kinase DhaKLM complex PTS-EIIA-like component DhaM